MRTNDPFFVEQTANITATSGEEELVKFLYSLGEESSLIRVRDLGLHPDAPRYTLNANIKLVANYQRKSAPKLAPVAALPAASKAQPPPPASPDKSPAPVAAPANTTMKQP
jgi:hypothetical protein